MLSEEHDKDKSKQTDIGISTWQNHFQHVLGNAKSQVPGKESGNEEQCETQSDTNTEVNVTHIPELDDPITEQEI